MIKQLWNKFFAKKVKEAPGFYVIAQLNDKVMPIDRGEVYEDPLNDLLKLNFYGEVTGGGTLLEINNEISYCDLELCLAQEPTSQVLNEIIAKLEELGAPKGSKLIVEKTDQQIPFGKLEGLALYLDGVNLSDEVYQNSDTEAIANKIQDLVGIHTDILRYWQGNTETALYFYGQSFERMNNAIADLVATDPECQNARVVQIA
jgi:hypothetical protein